MAENLIDISRKKFFPGIHQACGTTICLEQAKELIAAPMLMTMPQLFNKYASGFDIKNHAFIVVDQQELYCNPQLLGTKGGHDVAVHNNKIIQKFREAGVAVYIVYMDDAPGDGVGYEQAMGGPYRFERKPGDVLFRKNIINPLDVSNLDDIRTPLAKVLRQDNKKTLWFSGFNLGFCLGSGVISGKRDEEFDANVLVDCSGSDASCSVYDVRNALQSFHDENVGMTHADNVLDTFQVLRAA